MAYIPTNWVDNVTMMDDDALNKIENGIVTLDTQLADMATQGINIKSFGTIGNSNYRHTDGIYYTDSSHTVLAYDDTVSITNALAYCNANNKTLYFPIGNYQDSLQRNITCSIKGENQYNTKWIYTGVSGIFITTSSYYTKNARIDDISLILGDVTKTVSALKIMYTDVNGSQWGGSIKCNNVLIYQFTDKLLHLSDTFNCDFNNVTLNALNPSKAKLLVVESVNSFANGTTFTKCCLFNAKIGVQLLGCADVKFQSCTFENLTLLLNIVKTTLQPDVTFDKCWFELISSPAILNAQIVDGTLTLVTPTTGFCSLFTIRYNSNWYTTIATPILNPVINPSYEGVVVNYTLAFGASVIVPNQTSDNLTYYVSTTGNDSNNGSTVGTAFLTIAKAISRIPQVVNHTVTINVAVGSYAEQIFLSGYTGKGNILITGGSDLATAVNYIIQSVNIENCGIKVYVAGFIATTTAKISFHSKSCINVYYRYCTSTATASNNGFQFVNALGYIINCLISNKSIALYVGSMSTIVSRDWTSGSGNGVGIHSELASTVGKTGIQPQGTTPESTASGGVIR